MTKFVLSAAALLATAAPAFAVDTIERPIAFERDGIRYVAVVKTIGDRTVISGHEVLSGKAFELSVRNGKVEGVYAAQNVSYTVNR